MEVGGRMWSGGICFANDDENVQIQHKAYDTD